MSIALTDVQTALAASVTAFAARHAPPAVTRDDFSDLAAGRLLPSWKALWEQGLLTLHLPAEVGGDEAGVADVAVVLESLAFGLFPGPVLPTVLTGLALTTSADDRSAVRDALSRLGDGSTAAIATSTDGLTATRTAGGWRVSGDGCPILGALSADLLVLGATTGDQEVWFIADPAQLEVVALESVDLTRDLGFVHLDDVEVSTGQVLNLDEGVVRSLAATVFAAEAAGVARWAQEAGLAYAKVREQFGRPIGSFQAIKHKCAQVFTRTELITAAAWDAAISYDDDASQFALASAAAAVTCLPGAVEVGLDTATLLGGVGYTWEHDAHLYSRRAMSLQALLGPPGRWQQRVGRLSEHTRRRYELALTDEPDGLRALVSGHLAVAAGLPEELRRGFLAEHGLVAPHFRRPFGLGVGPTGQVVIAQEYDRAGIEQPSLDIGEWALPTIVAHGTDEQREALVWPTLTGALTWCQLFSEPDAGSDLASLRTRAEKVQGGWRLSGQKVWTSDAQHADWGVCLARSEPEASKHAGLSYFVVDMRSPGVEIRPLREANGGHLFNEVFLNDVFVPDSGLVGMRGEGWALARTTLGNERVNIATGMGRRADLPADYFDQVGVVRSAIGDSQLGVLTAEAMAFGALSQRTLCRQLTGLEPGPEASVLKVVSAANLRSLRRAGLDLMGPEAAALDGAGGGAAHEFLSLPSLLIGGGTLEVQLNVISERVLGLPRG